MTIARQKALMLSESWRSRLSNLTFEARHDQKAPGPPCGGGSGALFVIREV